jgi:hypothetical protein
MYESIHAPSGTRDVDLLIRNGGEQRLSDFLLWESAYAELFFTDVLWPDFTEADLASAVQAFAARDRRYGGIRTAAPMTAGAVYRPALFALHAISPAAPPTAFPSVSRTGRRRGARLHFANWTGLTSNLALQVFEQK